MIWMAQRPPWSVRCGDMLSVPIIIIYSVLVLRVGLHATQFMTTAIILPSPFPPSAVLSKGGEGPGLEAKLYHIPSCVSGSWSSLSFASSLCVWPPFAVFSSPPVSSPPGMHKISQTSLDSAFHISHQNEDPVLSPEGRVREREGESQIQEGCTAQF